MLASDINLTPVSGSNKSKINIKNICSSLLNGGHIPSDPYEFNGPVTTSVTGRCLRFDMDCEEDRSKYADLVSVATSNGGKGIHIVWEEHVNTPTGGLILYVCFVELDKVASKFIED